MYIHIGNGFVLKREDIVGVFDMDNSTSSRITRDFLSAAEKRGALVNTAEDIPKAFVVTGNGNIFLSQLMSQTLYKRSQSRSIE